MFSYLHGTSGQDCQPCYPPLQDTYAETVSVDLPFWSSEHSKSWQVLSRAIRWGSLSSGAPPQNHRPRTCCGGDLQTLPGWPDASPWPDAGRVLAAPTKGFRCESLTEPQQGSGTQKEVTTLKVTPSELKLPKEWNHRLVKLENVFISVTWLTRLPHILLRFWSCLHSVMSCNSKNNSYNFMRCWQHSKGTFPCDFHILQLFFNFTIIFSNASLYRKYVCWSGRPKWEFSNKNILRHNKWKCLHQNTKTDLTI